MPTPVTPIDSLTPAESRVTQHVARGLTSGEIAIKLRLARGTVDGQLRHAQYKLSVSSRTALIHRSYTREQLPRPERIQPPHNADEADIEILRLLAAGATHAQIAQHSIHELSHCSVKSRLKKLREKWAARNDAHLITRAWEFGILDESEAADTTLSASTPAVERTTGTSRSGEVTP
ncbi:LuxR C-terminal-related transcriptional regulator [Streptomyces sp. NPDC093707]|uniref:helix-turn-helix domain-containing protein n=1 Tax=Streptomyces sp. NPDC093707 TaxID=3154984 RepID=UPI00344BE244